MEQLTYMDNGKPVTTKDGAGHKKVVCCFVQIFRRAPCFWLTTQFLDFQTSLSPHTVKACWSVNGDGVVTPTEYIF